MNTCITFVENLLINNSGLAPATIQYLTISIIVIVLIIACIIGYRITNTFVITVVTRIVKKTKNTYDDLLLERGVFNNLAQITPAIVINYAIPSIIESAPKLAEFLSDLSQTWIIIVLLLTIYTFLNTINDIYEKSKISRNRSIKGYFQLLKIILFIASTFAVIAIFYENFDISKVFAGLGAMAAVLLLIFRDTILGLVASIQIGANDMVRLGDWIVMPKYQADGDVIEINLNTIKIQNWDKTISTIPVYALVTDSFQNWRGMSESGGRRIKRSINIDMRSVKFVDDTMLEKLKKFHLLNDYITNKEKELAQRNTQKKGDFIYNADRQTNLGIFRKYLEAYLHQLPVIHDNMTFLVRHLQPTEKGIPMEIYVFTKEQEWAMYEEVQANIFDHVLAIIQEFDLRVFQNPSGEDIRLMSAIQNND